MTDDCTLSLTEALDQLRAQGVTSLHRSNLTARNIPIEGGGRESILEQLAREKPPLARVEVQGQRTRWWLSPEALPRLAARATGRPGPEPGVQITLDAEQIEAFCRYVSAATDPIGELRAALSAATGLPPETVRAAEKVVIPLSPRGTRQLNSHSSTR